MSQLFKFYMCRHLVSVRIFRVLGSEFVQRIRRPNPPPGHVQLVQSRRGLSPVDICRQIRPERLKPVVVLVPATRSPSPDPPSPSRI